MEGVRSEIQSARHGESERSDVRLAEYAYLTLGTFIYTSTIMYLTVDSDENSIQVRNKHLAT